jgi:Flp pilus assembly protein TadD
MKGDSLEAGHLFASVLALDPKNRIAATNLAVLEARNHNLAQARALLQPVFDRNQDLLAVAENLAAIDCLQGDGAAARTTLEVALRFSPGSHDLQQRLAQIGACHADGPARAMPHE